MASSTARSLAGRTAAHTRWAHEPDRRAALAPARRGLIARFEREVDPDFTLSPDERARRAQSAMKAHMSRLAAKSAAARRGRAGGVR